MTPCRARPQDPSNTRKSWSARKKPWSVPYLHSLGMGLPHGIAINSDSTQRDDMRMFFYLICFSALTVIASQSVASPCDGVDRQISDEMKATLAPAIAKQLDASEVEILQSFRFGRWSIFYVDTHKADEVFLFFSGNPLTTHYVTLWGGAASRIEEKSIKGWVLKNVPGIPRRLASCFAWHVTRHRDM